MDTVRTSITHIVKRLRRTAPPVAEAPAPEEARVTTDALAGAVAHLELLGYEAKSLEPEWLVAEHPYRFNIALRAFPEGIKMFTSMPIGDALRPSPEAWSDFLNRANTDTALVRFTLHQRPNGLYEVRLRAIVTGTYERKVFAIAVDRWHEDVAYLQHAPSSAVEPEKTGVAAAESVLVH